METSFIIIIILAYFFGSISSAVLICKILCLPDPRFFGSNNPGATNILRIAGYKIAIVVIMFDALKGAIPIWLGYYLVMMNPKFLGITAIFSCLGHMYPVFLKFRGGKGVSTAFGSISAMNYDFFLIMISLWITIILISRYASLSAIVTASVVPFYTWYFQYQYLFAIIVISTLIVTKHIPNIKLLWIKQEKHIWGNKNKKAIHNDKKSL
ncbi:glycerol-3-phosphate 1-O-acyltransferase PlsY [Candidatus Blochmannia ocreatus (nom. nud.)]|uniref:Glycerol-3-phosphate acyltransferase n=1 Tax=Candidatus Blochmannia ocreatus (nom. nud.) TaxID=251538 RepID=A0ABY4SUJ8_9ENTR|nr:glycerol-3-phosphate 1-O-acyltransferase PlsY [Candidatus Blochmannia ocreatus]URJ25148.1 glycerol-3-phosphate 1-O-acyltransferase PlsY [Candidatus Blochmannia ocreatus]